jgi:hypothetical protein
MNIHEFMGAIDEAQGSREERLSVRMDSPGWPLLYLKGERVGSVSLTDDHQVRSVLLLGHCPISVQRLINRACPELPRVE